MMKLDEKGERDFQFLVNECRKAGVIDQNLYAEYDVKRGLRDSNGAGVLTGLTEISDVTAYKLIGGRNGQSGVKSTLPHYFVMFI